MTPLSVTESRQGIALVTASALAWSLGGAIARALTVSAPWTIVSWRAGFAAAFILGAMLLREGWRGTWMQFRDMGLAGVAVGLCIAVSSISFIIALAYTTVANILLMQASIPLLAALMTWLLFGERIGLATWGAIGGVIVGVGIMVSQSLTGHVSPIGDGLALLISFAFATATVITKRSSHVRMAPAACFGMMAAAFCGLLLQTGLAVSPVDFALLFVFGAVNLGFGLVLWVTGARLIPAPVAALVGTLETVLGPVWVWLVHSEVPSSQTLIGGGVVFAALMVHLTLEWMRAPVAADATA